VLRCVVVGSSLRQASRVICVAVCCGVLQIVVTYSGYFCHKSVVVRCIVLQCVAVWYSVVQCVAQCVAVCVAMCTRTTLLHVAVCCSVSAKETHVSVIEPTVSTNEP